MVRSTQRAALARRALPSWPLASEIGDPPSMPEPRKRANSDPKPDFDSGNFFRMTFRAARLISDYERDKLRPYADVVARLATALGVSTDELLGVAAAKPNGAVGNRRFLRRVQLMDQLPKRDQDALLRTIDAFLAARKAS